MKINRKKEELVQQILYALLGLTFIAALLVSVRAYSSDVTVIGGKDQVTMTGEISSIEGDGFALKHENGLTLVSLKDIEKKDKAMLQTAEIIKIGNKVTVSGKLDKGMFNNPVVVARNIVVEQTAQPPAVQVVPTPIQPPPVVSTPAQPAPAVPTTVQPTLVIPAPVQPAPTVTVVPPAE